MRGWRPAAKRPRHGIVYHASPLTAQSHGKSFNPRETRPSLRRPQTPSEKLFQATWEEVPSPSLAPPGWNIRPSDVPDAANFALLIAQAGTAGVSRDALCKVIQISPETLEELLRALIIARQVVVVQVRGQLVYRAAM